jgi:hypothetical protein
MGLVFVALAVRIGTQIALAQGNDLADTFRLPLFGGSFALLAGALWLNRSHPGLLAVAIGAASNGIAIVVNGGWMPVWEPALAAVGINTGELNTTFHLPLPDELGLEFLLRNGPLGDVIPIPLPLFANVASIGDVLIGAGLGWFVFATLLRQGEPQDVGIALGPSRPATTLPALDRPVVLGGGRGPGLPAPGSGARTAPTAAPFPIGARLRGHAYVRLALDARFVSFWVAQTISLFGDRLHQVALGVLVLAITNSPLLPGGDPAQHLPRTDSRNLRRPLESQARDDFQRRATRRPRADAALRGVVRRGARVPDRVPHYDRQPVLPSGKGRGRSANREAGRSARSQ